jgi:hypothetical protein
MYYTLGRLHISKSATGVSIFATDALQIRMISSRFIDLDRSRLTIEGLRFLISALRAISQSRARAKKILCAQRTRIKKTE